MAATWFNDGLVLYILTLLGYESSPDCFMRLFTNNHIPANTDTLFTYTQPANTGYAPIELAPFWNPPTAANGIAILTASTPVVFNFNAYGGAPETIYGYWLYDNVLGVALCAERFATPYVIPNAGGILSILPTAQLQGIPSIPAVVLKDQCLDVNGTNLAAHLMDVGSGWTNQIGTFQIQSNSIQANSDADGDQATADATVSDFTMGFDVMPTFTNSSNTERPGVVFRWSSTTNFWFVDIAADLNTVNLIKVNGGSFLIVATATVAFTSGTTHNTTVIASGSSIKVNIDGITVITVSDSFNSSATKVGVRLGKIGTSGKCSWKNLLVTTP